MELGFHKIILIAFLTSSVQCSDFFRMSQISQDMEQILRTINGTTVTSCQMKCTQDSNCKGIGLTQGFVDGSLYNCHLLKKKIDGQKESKINGQNDGQTKNGFMMTKVENMTKEPVKKWKLYTIFGCIERPMEFKILMVISKVTRQYKLQVEVKRTKFESQAGMVVKFETMAYRKDMPKLLEVPYIFFEKQHELGIRVRSEVNGEKYDKCISSVVHPLNVWVKIEVSQIKQGREYIWRALVDGKEICKVKNTFPEEFRQVRVVLTDNRYRQAGFVRNLLMMVEDE